MLFRSVLTITRFATDADARTNRLPGQVTTIRFRISIDPADAPLSPGGPNGAGGTNGPGGNPGGYPGYGDGGGSTDGGVTGEPPVAVPGAILGGGGPSAVTAADSQQALSTPRAKPNLVIKKASPRGG